MAAAMVSLLLALSVATAQTVPAGASRTLHTTHFRVHYTDDGEAFARNVASRLESFRERVAAEVGYVPDRRMDVIVVDPLSLANGQALADSRSPRMRLYASTPPADSSIGHHRDWAESLVVHEDTHLVHLTIPARNGLQRAIQRTLGVGPLSGLPRWVVEGYATVIEGRLTGAGRPQDDARAVWLRLLARTGRFPAYDELSFASRHRGGEFAYLVGSAFLEWLEREHRPGALRDLWARLSAKRRRSFVSAFRGVFGDDPATEYGRFVVEVMAEAYPTPAPDVEGRVAERKGSLGAPSVSPNGTRVAIPWFPRDQLPRLLVLETGPPANAAKKRQEQIDRLLTQDPLDVAPVPPPYLARKVAAVRVFGGRTARSARFVDDTTILFDALTPEPTGRFGSDLFLWDLEDGRERRITKRADLRDADPSSDGTWAVAVRQRWGRTAIVEVDLASGGVTPITALRLDVQVDGPRISPDGEALVWLENRGTGYGWVRYDRATQRTQWHAVTLDGPQLRNLAFAPDGTLFAETAWQGELAVQALGPADAQAGTVVLDPDRRYALPGGAQAPTFARDGVLWVTTMTPNGTALHTLDEPSERVATPPTGILDRAPSPPPPPPAERRAGFRRPYGLGHWSWIPLVGFGVSSVEEGQVEAALTGGDVMGRVSAEGWVSVAPEGRGVQGASLALGARTARSRWRLTGFLGRDGRFDQERAGGELAHRGTLPLGSAVTLGSTVGGVLERVDLDQRTGPDGGLTRWAGAAGAWLSYREPRSRAFAVDLSARGQVGRTGSDPFRLVRARATVQLGRQGGVAASVDIGHSTGTTVLDRFTYGGSPVTVWPTFATEAWVTDPAVMARRQEGSHFDRIDVGVGAWQLQGFATRTRVGGSFTGGGVTLVGIRGGITVDSDPFALLVADGRGSVGVGRTIEDPENGFSWRDGQFFAFASWTWR